MGEVYKARDIRLGREVAIKLSKEKFSERFEREADERCSSLYAVHGLKWAIWSSGQVRLRVRLRGHRAK